MPRPGVTLSLYPAFTDGADLSDTLYKLAFQAWPYLEHVRQVRLWRSGDIANRPLMERLELPDYLDPACADAFSAMRDRIVELPLQSPFDENALKADEASHVLIWDQAAGMAGREVMPVLDGLYHAGRTLFVDRATCLNDAGAIQYLFFMNDPDRDRQRAEAFDRFIAATTRCWGRRQNAYLFAPGPSLTEGIDGRRFDDGVRIVCNSLVTSPSLMKRLQPDFICIADDFLHAGAIRYAGEFRRALNETLQSTTAVLICRAAHQRLFEFLMPESLRHRIVGVTCDGSLASPNLDMVRNFWIRDTGNILTMFMLPLAATFARRIQVFGFDGRAPAEHQKIWSYAAEFPIENLRSSLYAAHPAQGDLSGAEFVSRHETQVAQFCDALDASGRKVIARTASYIPAFRDRFVSRRSRAWQRWWGLWSRD